MKQKIVTAIFILFGISMFGCSYHCNNNQKAHCDDQVPNEACQAAFQRWFYNAATNQCQQISYSGCGAYGFDTKSDCEKCQCH
jgi:hypothetical protein